MGWPIIYEPRLSKGQTRQKAPKIDRPAMLWGCRRCCGDAGDSPSAGVVGTDDAGGPQKPSQRIPSIASIFGAAVPAGQQNGGRSPM